MLLPQLPVFDTKFNEIPITLLPKLAPSGFRLFEYVGLDIKDWVREYLLEFTKSSESVVQVVSYYATKAAEE
jgi:hypothetical protein